MSLILIGINHTSAPVEVREHYAVSQEQIQALLEKLVREPACDEAVLVSTCNRTELIVASSAAREAVELCYRLFAEEIGDGSAEPRHFYEFRDGDAALHVLRVASSLDSMVLGEAQILGQLKQAHRAAVSARACGPLLNRLFERAFRAAKRVRSETGLGAAAVSVARIGVQLAAEIFESFEGKRALLIGAGEMGESALHGLRDAGATDLCILNRTEDAAARLAGRFGAEAGGLDTMPAELARADIALCSVAVERPLIGPEVLAECMQERLGRPLLLIDLGIPRNVDPQANAIDAVYLYDLDDLDEIAERGRRGRRGASGAAEAIVSAELEQFERWRLGLDAVPVIRELRSRALALGHEEAQRAARLASTDPEALERMAQALIAKLLHRPLERLRREAEEGSAPYYATAVRELFGLTEDDE